MGARKSADVWLNSHDETDKAAQAIMDKEAARRDDKIARLRQARLQRAASDMADAAWGKATKRSER